MGKYIISYKCFLSLSLSVPLVQPQWLPRVRFQLLSVLSSMYSSKVIFPKFSMPLRSKMSEIADSCSRSPNISVDQTSVPSLSTLLKVSSVVKLSEMSVPLFWCPSVLPPSEESSTLSESPSMNVVPSSKKVWKKSYDPSTETLPLSLNKLEVLLSLLPVSRSSISLPPTPEEVRLDSSVVLESERLYLLWNLLTTSPKLMVVTPCSLVSESALVYGQMNEPPGARARVGLTGLTVAEYFRDEEGQDVLLFVDNIFRFTQANSEVSALLGRIPSAVVYQPTLATDLGGLQERITTTSKGSITSVQAIYVPADDLTDPAPATTFAHLDATTVLSRP